MGFWFSALSGVLYRHCARGTLPYKAPLTWLKSMQTTLQDIFKGTTTFFALTSTVHFVIHCHALLSLISFPHRTHKRNKKAAEMRNALAYAILSTFVGSIFYLSVYLRAVPTRHIVFTIGTAAYASLANVFILRSSDSLPARPSRPRDLSPMKKSTRLLFPFTIVISLVVPSVLLAVAPVGDPRPSQLQAVVAPHLFLMLSQIVFETVGYLAFSFYTLYIRLEIGRAHV